MDVFSENSTIDCNNTFTKNQKNIVLIVNSGTGLISLIMCMIVVSLVFCMRLYKNFTYRLAMYQILSSLCLSAVEVSFITQNLSTENYCFPPRVRFVDEVIIYTMSHSI